MNLLCPFSKKILTEELQYRCFSVQANFKRKRFSNFSRKFWHLLCPFFKKIFLKEVSDVRRFPIQAYFKVDDIQNFLQISASIKPLL
jgi:hypothetical protein